MEEDRDDARVYIFSSYLQEGDISSARTYLDNIEPQTEAMADFVAIQRIQLDRLPYGQYYEASADELDIVYMLAHKEHSYAAYAKALYYGLTGEMISSQLPDIDHEVTPRHIVEEVNDAVLVHPNPFKDQLTVSLDELGDASVTVRISNVVGQEVYMDTTDQSMAYISTTGWQQACYQDINATPI